MLYLKGYDVCVYKDECTYIYEGIFGMTPL
jgi:hypothetical protein